MYFLAAASAPPTFVNISGITSSSFTVHWGPVDCIHHNGDITGYSVRYGVRESWNKTMYISGDATTQSTIQVLYSSTKYFTEVAAVNNAGTGVFSTAIFTLTNGMMLHNISKYKLLVVYIMLMTIVNMLIFILL